MNIDELRDLIKDLPGNLPVYAYTENPYGNESLKCTVEEGFVRRDGLYLDAVN